MDFKGKPVEYWESRRTTIKNKTPGVSLIQGKTQKTNGTPKSGKKKITPLFERVKKVQEEQKKRDTRLK